MSAHCQRRQFTAPAAVLDWTTLNMQREWLCSQIQKNMDIQKTNKKKNPPALVSSRPQQYYSFYVTNHGNIFIINEQQVPLRSILLDGNLFRHFALKHKKGKAPHHSTAFCGQEKASQADRGFGRKFCLHFHQPKGKMKVSSLRRHPISYIKKTDIIFCDPKDTLKINKSSWWIYVTRFTFCLAPLAETLSLYTSKSSIWYQNERKQLN